MTVSPPPFEVLSAVGPRLRRWQGLLLRWCLLVPVILTQCATMPPRSHAPCLRPGTWSTGDGKSLPYTLWAAQLPKQRDLPPPKAIVICVHGLSGAASDFWPLGQELPSRGLSVYGMQLRGQGNDPDLTARGDIKNRHEWMMDLREFTTLVAAEHPGVPIFWLGESLGSLITLHTVTEAPREKLIGPRGVILLSPPVALRKGLPWWKGCLARMVSRVAPTCRIPLATLDPSRVPSMQITRDATQASQAPLTPHLVPSHSLRLLREVHSLMVHSEAAAGHLALPTLVLYTPNDPVASRRQIEGWFSQIASLDKTPLFFPDDFHLILHDDHRWQATTQIGDWLLGHVARPSSHKAGR